MIGLLGVTFGYAGRPPLLRDVTLRLPERGIVCLAGPSGCGKTTILRLLAGLETPLRGTVEGVRTLRIAPVFQEDRLLPWRTVRENVALTAAEGAAIDPLLRSVAVEEWGDQFPHELSGGMARRVAIARALAMDAQLLLLDEPFNGLDPALCRQIADLLREQAERRLIVLVSHDAQHREMLGAATVHLTPPVQGELQAE